MKEIMNDTTKIEKTKRKEFEDAELQVIRFNANDIVVASNCATTSPTP